MALVIADRVKETSTTTGTGTLTLGGAATGYQTFSAAIGSGNTCYYAITLDSDWEVGIGTVGTGTLSRDSVLASSNSNSLVNFGAGTKDVFVTHPASAIASLVSGPASVIAGRIATFDGTSGKAIQDSGKSLPSGTVVGTTDAQTLTGKTIAYADNTLTGVQPTLVSGTTIKTINSVSVLGSGDIATGDVVGPASATDNAVALFNGTTGKLLKSGTVLPTFPSGTIVGTTDTQTLTNKTLTDPKISLSGTNGTAGQVPVSQGAGLPPVWGSVSTAEVKTPTNVSPATGSTNIGATPALTGSTYYSLYGVPMAAAQWQVSTVNDFATTVVNTGDVAGTSVAYTVGSGVLSTSTTYYWRVRYKDSNGVYSDWSTATTFTTAASFGPTTIGEAYGGGYYAGKIVQGGATYYLIVAPKSSGENSSKQWKTSNDAGPTATQTLNNGPAASAAMNSATYPAAQFCEGLSIGGYTDWYLPARDELELCYRNLKPTTTTNNTSARPKSSYTYPEGNDVSGDTMGVNRNSSPTGAAYTSSSPAQTSVTLFQTGNTEAFAADGYWSSSEYSATDAWLQSFNGGTQSGSYKNGTYYVRAVRRLPV